VFCAHWGVSVLGKPWIPLLVFRPRVPPTVRFDFIGPRHVFLRRELGAAPTFLSYWSWRILLRFPFACNNESSSRTLVRCWVRSAKTRTALELLAALGSFCQNVSTSQTPAAGFVSMLSRPTIHFARPPYRNREWRTCVSTAPAFHSARFFEDRPNYPQVHSQAFADTAAPA
jgi:hypothetical protein